MGVRRKKQVGSKNAEWRERCMMLITVNSSSVEHGLLSRYCFDVGFFVFMRLTGLDVSMFVVVPFVLLRFAVEWCC